MTSKHKIIHGFPSDKYGPASAIAFPPDMSFAEIANYFEKIGMHAEDVKIESVSVLHAAYKAAGMQEAALNMQIKDQYVAYPANIADQLRLLKLNEIVITTPSRTEVEIGSPENSFTQEEALALERALKVDGFFYTKRKKPNDAMPEYRVSITPLKFLSHDGAAAMVERVNALNGPVTATMVEDESQGYNLILQVQKTRQREIVRASKDLPDIVALPDGRKAVNILTAKSDAFAITPSGESADAQVAYASISTDKPCQITGVSFDYKARKPLIFDIPVMKGEGIAKAKALAEHGFHVEIKEAAAKVGHVILEATPSAGLLDKMENGPFVEDGIKVAKEKWEQKMKQSGGKPPAEVEGAKKEPQKGWFAGLLDKMRGK